MKILRPQDFIFVEMNNILDVVDES